MGSSLSSINPSTIINSYIFQPPNYEEKGYTDEKKKQMFLNIGTKFIKSKNGIKLGVVVVDQDPFLEEREKKHVIFSHGNAADIYQMYDYFRMLSRHFAICVVGYDYQGYGISEGDPSEKNCYKDLDTVVNYVQNNLKVNKNDIYLVGQSLGTGVVVEYASKNEWTNPIVLISPYKTIASVVTESSFKELIDKFKTIKKVNKLKCPVKIFHGYRDNIVPISHGKAIYNKLNENCKIEPSWIDNAGHNDILRKINLNDMRNVFFDLN